MWQNVWDTLGKQFEFMSTRSGGGDATVELIIMAATAFLLGFLFCYVQSKSGD